jgi:asparagine synthase (glutamine-hydrolysing)
LYPYLPAVQAQSFAYRKAFFHARPEDLADPFFSHRPRWDLTSRLKLFYSDAVRAELADGDVLAEARALLPADRARQHPFCRAQHVETAILLPGYILSSQGDRMAMAHAVEGRFPFLDHRVAEFAAKLPPPWKMLGLDEKHLLKRIARGLVPPEILRRSKQPYRAPDAPCFFGTATRPVRLDYVDELLSPARLERDGLFRPGAVARLTDKIRNGRVIGVKDNMALVGILSTQILLDQFVYAAGASGSASTRPVVTATPTASIQTTEVPR